MTDLPTANPDIQDVFDEANNFDSNFEIMPDSAKPAAPSNRDEIMPDSAKPAAPSNRDEIMPDSAKPAAPSNRDEIMPDSAKPAAPRGESSFTIPPSTQLKGKPYLIHDPLLWVMTKSGSHFPVVLKGTQIGDTVRISVLYDHEDLKDDRVKCENLRKGHETVFDVEPRTPKLQLAPCSQFNDLAMCSVTLLNSGCQSDEVTFRFKPNCLNFCSKPKSCSKRLLKFELLSKDGTILTTSTWNLRVCAGLLRDFNNMMGSVDPNTGEKRKPLYGKTSKNKKIKKEQEESAPANAVQEHQDTLSCSATRREHKEVETAYHLITGQALSNQPFSSGGGDMNEEIIHEFNHEAYTPLLEEKGITLCVENGRQSKGTSVAPRPFSCNSFNVQMNDMEDEKLVRNLIHRLYGTMHELPTTRNVGCCTHD